MEVAAISTVTSPDFTFLFFTIACANAAIIPQAAATPVLKKLSDKAKGAIYSANDIKGFNPIKTFAQSSDNENGVNFPSIKVSKVYATKEKKYLASFLILNGFFITELYYKGALAL